MPIAFRVDLIFFPPRGRPLFSYLPENCMHDIDFKFRTLMPGIFIERLSECKLSAEDLVYHSKIVYPTSF